MKQHDAHRDAQAHDVTSGSALDSTVVQSPADCGLNAEELAYFTLQHEGFTRARIAAELGWSSVKIERVRRRLNLRLARLRGGPAPKVIAPQVPLSEVIRVKTKTGKAFSSPISRFSYRERLPSGARVWTLSPSNHENFPNLPISGGEILHQGSRIIMTSLSLRQNLQDAKAKLARLGEKSHQCRLIVEKAERELDAAQAASKTEATEAALAEKEYTPSPATAKRLAQARNSVAHSKSDLDATVEAHRLQAVKVQEMEAAIAARRHETFVAASKDLVERVRRAIPALGEDSLALQTLAYENEQDYYSLMGLLFPGLKLGHFTENAYFNQAAGVFIAAGGLARAEWARAEAIGE